MPPQPPERYGLIRIPAPGATGVSVRYAPLTKRDEFDPASWPKQALRSSPLYAGWWDFDVDALQLADGVYEYEFLLDGNNSPIPDPYADEITRFGGYRGVFRVASRQRSPQAFHWDDEFDDAHPLKQNNEIVIYEMPVKWMSNDPIENPLVELGTFEKILFEHLGYLSNLGINCIELLPIQDSSQTLNWGYGTRFYFAPDYDIGSSVDAKFFIKTCHRLGIRVILDVVMNFFNPTCPLNQLAPLGVSSSNWFSVANNTDGRQNFGQVLFRFNTPSYNAYFAGREFLYQMAEFWVTEYHIDGYRIDDFADIRNWEFGQTFRQRATAANAQRFPPGKPFIIIAEDSTRNFTSTDGRAYNGDRVVDAIWNFGYRDEIRRLAQDQIATSFGQPSRTVRVQHALSREGVWNAFGSGNFDRGFGDLVCSISYVTSHDVADAPRLMNVILGSILRDQQLGSGDVPNIRSIIDGSSTDNRIIGAVSFAMYRVLGVFAILMTSVGIPMLLAGEEFADVHDLDFLDINTKQQDPIQWARASYPGQSALRANVAALIKLRTSHPALQRNEIEFFYFHPQFDDNVGPRVFGYARTGGTAIGSTGQVIVLANMGSEKFPIYNLPAWPWSENRLAEIGNTGAAAPIYNPAARTLSLLLDAFQARVFTS
jgi:pullulanase/glycogen debranching enzyme